MRLYPAVGTQRPPNLVALFYSCYLINNRSDELNVRSHYRESDDSTSGLRPPNLLHLWAGISIEDSQEAASGNRYPHQISP
jgi:hypothetical protein